MPSLEYLRDGSIIITRDDGQQKFILSGKQESQDAAVTLFLGPTEPSPITLEDLLVQKGILTLQDIITIKGVE